MRRASQSIMVVAVAVALLAAACSTNEDGLDADSLPPLGDTDSIIDGAVSLGEALAYMGRDPIAVEGFVVIDAEGARLCETLAESFPPQCGGAHLDITNPDVLTNLPLIEEGSTQWTDDMVILFGDVNENELTVIEVSS